jgi:hypothetical protein
VKERLRAVLPPDGTVAEARDRPGCACRSMPIGHNTAVRSARLLNEVMIFIKLGGHYDTGVVRRKEKGNCGGTIKSSRVCVKAYGELRNSPQGPKETGRRFIDPHIFR